MDIVNAIVDWIWGLPLLLLISSVSLYLLYLSKGAPFRYFIFGWKVALGYASLEDQKSGQTAVGQLSQLRALMNAVSSTVGLGNIAGVAVAIAQGGPGAIFWMWVAGLVGMNTKFFECTLSIMYRGKDTYGEVQGGPMYYMSHAFSSKKVAKVMAVIFALGGMLGTMALFQCSQLSDFAYKQMNISRYVTGVFCFVLLAFILKGGLKRLSNWTLILVPFMCWTYLLVCSWVILNHADQILPVFQLIVQSAFYPQSFTGAFSGLSVAFIFRMGLQRAAFSNEAGMGTAPMAHGNAKTSEPLSEGFVAMLGPFIDTIVVCTLTALLLLISTPYENLLVQSEINWVASIFQSEFGSWGTVILFLMVFLFSVTTMIGMANYNEKCWNYLLGRTFLKNRNYFILFFCSTLFLGATYASDFAISLIDIGFGIMAYTNFIALVILAPKVSQRLKEFQKKRKA